MIVLHLVLVMRRIGEQEGERGRFRQGLFDQFCRDLDDNLREMGVGDLTVPKEMRRLAGAFYGRQTAYHAALVRPDDDELVNALARNIFGAAAAPELPRRLASYVRAAVRELDARPDEALLRGEIAFPDPEAFAHDRV
jgi:cytochrome b pre-mRNA-processing protein 3